MRTGISYLGHHNPKHMESDIKDIKKLGCDDILLAAQENDFVYMKGKIDFFPKMAEDNKIRPLAIFWGALNYFGGGKSSQFLLEHPDVHQRQRDGSYNPAGCYNNILAVNYMKILIDRIAELGYAGYFIDEPSPIDCYCTFCERLFREMFDGELKESEPQRLLEFRKKCVINYVKVIADYIKKNHPKLETLCCVMPQDKFLWTEMSLIKNLDNLGTDIYWVNSDVKFEEMRPLVREMANICAANSKKHHQWLQCWGVKMGRHNCIKTQGQILLEENPDGLYVWAYQGQIGTSEACEDPAASWEAACDILRQAKNI